MYELGLAYEGLANKATLRSGVPQNSTRAAIWFRKAADGGNADAMRELGVLSGRGDGVPQSYSEEMRWYKLAAVKGDDVAML